MEKEVRFKKISEGLKGRKLSDSHVEAIKAGLRKRSAELGLIGAARDPLYSVYALVDPRNGAKMFIGVTNHPEGRFAAQLYYAYERVGSRTHETAISAWIRNVCDEGVVPELLILECDLHFERRLSARRKWLDLNPSALNLSMRSRTTTTRRKVRHVFSD